MSLLSLFFRTQAHRQEVWRKMQSRHGAIVNGRTTRERPNWFALSMRRSVTSIQGQAPHENVSID